MQRYAPHIAPYVRAFKCRPVFEIRAAILTALPAKVAMPAYKNASLKLFPAPREMIAPLTGGPHNIPIDERAKVIPSRTPTRERSGDRAATTVGGRDTIAPETNPYRMAKTTRPARDSMPVQAKMSMEAQMQHGMMEFRGPILSAKKLGTMRPKAEDAFMMLRR